MTASDASPSAATTRPAEAPITTLFTTATMPGGGQRKLPSTRSEPLAVQQALGRSRAHDEKVRFQLGDERHVQVPYARDPLRVCDVLKRGLNQALEGNDPHESQYRQQEQRKRVEGRPEPRHLPDEGERDEVAR